MLLPFGLLWIPALFPAWRKPEHQCSSFIAVQLSFCSFPFDKTSNVIKTVSVFIWSTSTLKINSLVFTKLHHCGPLSGSDDFYFNRCWSTFWHWLLTLIIVCSPLRPVEQCYIIGYYFAESLLINNCQIKQILKVSTKSLENQHTLPPGTDVSK